jgi:hypothetical protein
MFHDPGRQVPLTLTPGKTDRSRKPVSNPASDAACFLKHLRSLGYLRSCWISAKINKKQGACAIIILISDLTELGVENASLCICNIRPCCLSFVV